MILGAAVSGCVFRRSTCVQHRNCSHPTSICPPMSLLKAHACPQPVTLHLTHHASRITRHTSHVTRHSSPRFTTTPRTSAPCNGPSSCARAATAPPTSSPARYHASCARVPVVAPLTAWTATAVRSPAVRSGTGISLLMDGTVLADLLLLEPVRARASVLARFLCNSVSMHGSAWSCVRYEQSVHARGCARGRCGGCGSHCSGAVGQHGGWVESEWVLDQQRDTGVVGGG